MRLGAFFRSGAEPGSGKIQLENAVNGQKQAFLAKITTKWHKTG
jgi:hypothetical protein